MNRVCSVAPVKVAIAALLAFAIAACGTSSAPPVPTSSAQQPTTAPAGSAPTSSVDPSAGSGSPSGAPGGDYGNWEGQQITIAILGGQQPEVFAQAADLFQERTGLQVNIVDLPFGDLYPRYLTELRSGSGAFDIMSPPQYYVGDFVPYLQPLTQFFDAAPIEDYESTLSAFRELSVHAGEPYCLPTDGDIWSLYYRKSMFEDEQNRTDFETAYGYELAPPQTWEQFNQIGEFFTRDGQYGTAMMLARVFAGSEFAQRFYSFGGKWFDEETMDATVNGPAGVAALESIIGTVKASPPGVLNYGFTETNDDFVQGRIPMIVQWGDTGGHSGDSARAAAEVVGDVGYAPVPGAMIDGELNDPQLLAWGFCVMMSKDSQNKDAAWQFMRFVVSPEISTIMVAQHKGLDPYREMHFEDPENREQFPEAGEWLDQSLANVEKGVPDLKMTGAKQYYDLIAAGIGDALTANQNDLDAIDPQAVMDQIAGAMNGLTDELGRDAQRESYRGSMLSSPSYDDLPGD